jgi:hypothetical protein|tara:strand:- start:134 stop:328 length:195 start_codon:yes stop_codon:yes gene_type:complete
MGVIADNDVMNIVTKKITSILSLNLCIIILLFKKKWRDKSLHNFRVSAKIIGERSADKDHYIYL